MAEERTIAEAVMEDMASMVESPFEYVMVLHGMNKVHPDKELPMPRKEAQ